MYNVFISRAIQSDIRYINAREHRMGNQE